MRQIVDACKLRDLSKCDDVIIACNTAHLLAERVVAATGIPLRSLIESSAREIHSLNSGRIGIVASPLALESGLFDVLNGIHIQPDKMQRSRLEAMIRSVIAGKTPGSFEKELTGIIDSLFNRGAQHVLVGCTELELILREHKDKRLIKPLELTVSAILREAI